MDDRRGFLGRLLALPFAFKATQEGVGVQDISTNLRIHYATEGLAGRPLSFGGRNFYDLGDVVVYDSANPALSRISGVSCDKVFYDDPLRPSIPDSLLGEETECPFTHTFVIDVRSSETTISRFTTSL